MKQYFVFQLIALIILIILMVLSPSLINTATTTGIIILFIDEAILITLAIYTILKK